MEYKQMSLFEEDDCTRKKNSRKKETENDTSRQLLDAFKIYDVPFFYCDYELIYPEIKKILPVEKIMFSMFDTEIMIACEMICAAICHRMNWDFLRRKIFEKTVSDMEWVLPGRLLNITLDEVNELFGGYEKPDRIRPAERRRLLQELAIWIQENGGYCQVMRTDDKTEQGFREIHKRLLCCSVFGSDPAQKKLQLLFQKLSCYGDFSFLGNYCEPAIDYHLMRCFLRRGLLYPCNEVGKQYLSEADSFRKESTVAALRKYCIILIQQISMTTGLTISDVNQIEWHIGRTVCREEFCDCLLSENKADWLKGAFKKCPFFNTCLAAKDDVLKRLSAPIYDGTSY